MNRLQQLRKERGLSQSELGKLLSMPQNTVSQYETERRRMDPQTLLSFAKFFGVSIDYLVGVSNDRTGRESPPSAFTGDGEQVEDPLDLELMHLVKNLSEDQKELLLAQLKALNEQRK